MEREQRAATKQEMARLRTAWEKAQWTDVASFDEHVIYGKSARESWEVLEAELGPEEEPPSAELHDEELPGDELDLGGEGYTDEEIAAVVRLLAEGRLTARGLELASGMSFRRARRLWQWFISGAAGWDRSHNRLTAQEGLRWVKRKTPEGTRRTLIRSE